MVVRSVVMLPTAPFVLQDDLQFPSLDQAT